MKLKNAVLVITGILFAGVLSTLLVPRSLCIDPNTDIAVIAKAKLDIRYIYGTTMASRDDDSSFPTEEQWNKYFFTRLKEIPRDPWGREYIYYTHGDGNQFRIVSYGRDGEKGGEGLDTDWFYESSGKNNLDSEVKIVSNSKITHWYCPG